MSEPVGVILEHIKKEKPSRYDIPPNIQLLQNDANWFAQPFQSTKCHINTAPRGECPTRIPSTWRLNSMRPIKVSHQNGNTTQQCPVKVSIKNGDAPSVKRRASSAERVIKRPIKVPSNRELIPTMHPIKTGRDVPIKNGKAASRTIKSVPSKGETHTQRPIQKATHPINAWPSVPSVRQPHQTRRPAPTHHPINADTRQSVPSMPPMHPACQQKHRVLIPTRRTPESILTNIHVVTIPIQGYSWLNHFFCYIPNQ